MALSRRLAGWAAICLTAICFASASGPALATTTQVYWSDSDAPAIWRSNDDGSGAGVVVPLAVGSEPRGVAIDQPRGVLYWTENGTNRIRRSSLDGTAIQDVVTTGLGFPADLEIDSAAGKMYWADRDLDVIRRANLDGSSVETIVNVPAPGNNGAPYFLELDTGGGKLYWTDFDSGTIHRANLDGTLQENLVTGLDRVRDVAVNAGKLYWNDRDTILVQRQNLDGTQRETLFGPTGLVLPHGLAIDPAAGLLYFADSDGRQINRGPLAGGTFTTIATAGLVNPWDVELVVVPEPSTLLLLATAAGMFVLGRRCRSTG